MSRFTTLPPNKIQYHLRNSTIMLLICIGLKVNHSLSTYNRLIYVYFYTYWAQN